MYEKSANLGFGQAMYNVALCYTDGNGVTKDLVKAREWLTKSAAQGEEDAQTRLDNLNAQ